MHHPLSEPLTPEELAEAIIDGLGDAIEHAGGPEPDHVAKVILGLDD